MDALPQEFPCQGNGDFRSPAISVKNADGSYGCDLRYKSYEVKKGKYGINPTLSMDVSPTLIPDRHSTRYPGVGVQWALNF